MTIEELLNENEQLRNAVLYQQQIIWQAFHHALAIQNRAEEIHSQHQPRGTWVFWDGMEEAARQMCQILSAYQPPE